MNGSKKPLLKWVGGKTQIMDEVFSMFPKEMENYHEPFVGGGSVLVEVLNRKRDGHFRIHGKKYASDVNARLIWFYKNVQRHPRDVWKHLKELKEDYDKCSKREDKNYCIIRKPQSKEDAYTSQESMYYWQRKRFNEIDTSSEEAAALLLFLNKTCFRGIYREGPNGYNVPFGNYKNTSLPHEESLMAMSA